MAEKLICMTEKEISRSEVMKNLIDQKINGTDASKQIGVSVRHIRRIKRAVMKNGISVLAHGNRGKDSNRKLDQKTVVKAKKYLTEKYYDFGPTFASEKLSENHSIEINKETVRKIMVDLGLWKIKPKKNSGKKKHFWRARKDNFGEMEQFDGSYHVWFGEEESCLLLSADDATGKITYAKFDINESTLAVFAFWTEYFKKNGLPLSIYLDKFSTYKINHKNAVDDPDMITQFQRAMRQVGVRPITAHSAEAKGRVERMFQTLQDRLVKELRLAGITTIDDANKFLKEYVPKFNKQFAVLPARRKNLHTKLSKQIEGQMSQIFSIQDERKVNNDYTIMFKTKFFQLEETQPTTVYKKDRIIVEEHLDGSIKLRKREKYLNYFILPERPKKVINIKLPAITIQKQSSYKPPINHPWRKQILFNRQKVQSK